MTATRDSCFALQNAEMLAQLAASAPAFGAQLGRDHWRADVLHAMSEVPRHHHVAAAWASLAYADAPLPTGRGTTTPQPLIVVLMTDLLNVGAEHRVLEIGTGLGYNTAVLARLGAHIATVEIEPRLAAEAERRLRNIGNVRVALGDGLAGWPEVGLFDRIVLTGAVDIVPETLLLQLAPGGRLVAPAGLPGEQRLLVIDKAEDGHLSATDFLSVSFAPLSSGTNEPLQALEWSGN